ncbi:MAG: hypothetical protein Q8Q14_01875 [Gemmatimonadales bacterium]|nr:hypothetical protein [Gemmatimonadales bacterium]
MTTTGGQFDADARQVEHRLTKLDGLIERVEGTLSMGFAGINERLDTLNGHVAEINLWRGAHITAHAMQDGITAGRVEVRASFSTRDKYVLGVFVLVVQTALGVALKLWG